MLLQTLVAEFLRILEKSGRDWHRIAWAIRGLESEVRDSSLTAADWYPELEEYLEKFEGQLNEHDIKHLKTAITSLSWQGWHLTGSLKREIQEKIIRLHIFHSAEGRPSRLLRFGKSGNQILVVNEVVLA
jgi:hypothetical protein